MSEIAEVDEPNNSNFNRMAGRDQIDKTVLEFIDGMEFPKIYVGPITPNDMKKVNWQTQRKGKMTPEEKELFDYANRLLQYPSSILKARSFRAASRRVYSYSIARYLVFMAKRKVAPVQFTIDGVLMTENMREYVAEKIEEGVTGDFNDTIEGAQHGLAFFNHCIALYKCRDIQDSGASAIKVKELKTIPNLSCLTDFMRERRQLWKENSRDNFHDKHIDGYTNETYTIDNLKAMMVNMYSLTGTEGKKNIFNGINTVLEILMGHHLLYRGGNKREVELSDITFTDYDSARGKVPILAFTTNRSRTATSKEKTHSMGACRNKDVEICLVTAISMSIWYRFDFEGDHAPLAGNNRPNFLDKRNWYPVKVLFADSAQSRNNEAISYKYEASLVNLCFQSIGVVLNKKKSVGRRAAGRRADANLVESSQINRAGDGKQSILDGVYLKSYHLNFVFSSGGFSPEEPYGCIRDIEPSESLQKQIFPWLESVIDAVNARDNESGWVGQNTQDNDKDIAAANFLQMLKTFRKVILQDLTNLMDRAPESIFAKHPITKDPEFLIFKEKVAKAQTELYLSQDMEDRKSLANVLTSTFVKKVDTLKLGLNAVHSSLLKKFDEFEKEQERILSRRNDELINQLRRGVAGQVWDIVSDGDLNERVRNNSARSQVQELAQRVEAMEKIVGDVAAKQVEDSKLFQSISKSMEVMSKRMEVICNRVCGPNAEFLDPIITNSVMDIDMTALEGEQEASSNISASSGSSLNQDGTSNETQTSRSSGSGFTALTDAVPSLKMRLGTDTVMKLLDEWYVSKPGILSVEKRDVLFGHKWRVSCSIYKRRKAIIAFIETHVKSKEEFVNITREELGLLVEGYRIRNGLKLNALSSRCQNAVYKKEIAEELQQIWDQRNQQVSAEGS